MPFTVNQFFDVFAAYNLAIWPAHIVAYILGLVAVGGALTRTREARSLAAAILGLGWCWNGIAYHFCFFAEINWAANGFAALFLIQGLLLIGLAFRIAAGPTAEAVRGSGLQHARTLAALTGGTLIVYAMVVYPLLGSIAGHGWPNSPGFGVAPCPTTIFTLGILLLWWPRTPWWVIAIPLIWAAIGSTAAVLLAVPEDFGLLAAGLVTFGWLLFGRASRRPEPIAYI